MQEVLPGEAPKPAQGQGQDALPRLRLSPSAVRPSIALAICALSGLLLSLALPPANLGVLAFLAPIRSVAGLAGLWTVQEWLRGMWPVGGFGWGQLGSTQTGNPLLIRLASVTGVWGVSFVVVLVAGLLMLAVERARSRPTSAVVLAGISLVLSLSPGLIPIPRPDGRTLDVAAIQVDVRRARGLPPVLEDQRVAKMNVALHRRLKAARS